MKEAETGRDVNRDGHLGFSRKWREDTKDTCQEVFLSSEENGSGSWSGESVRFEGEVGLLILASYWYLEDK